MKARTAGRSQRSVVAVGGGLLEGLVEMSKEPVVSVSEVISLVCERHSLPLW